MKDKEWAAKESKIMVDVITRNDEALGTDGYTFWGVEAAFAYHSPLILSPKTGKRGWLVGTFN